MSYKMNVKAELKVEETTSTQVASYSFVEEKSNVVSETISFSFNSNLLFEGEKLKLGVANAFLELIERKYDIHIITNGFGGNVETKLFTQLLSAGFTSKQLDSIYISAANAMTLRVGFKSDVINFLMRDMNKLYYCDESFEACDELKSLTEELAKEGKSLELLSINSSPGKGFLAEVLKIARGSSHQINESNDVPPLDISERKETTIISAEALSKWANASLLRSVVTIKSTESVGPIDDKKGAAFYGESFRLPLLLKHQRVQPSITELGINFYANLMGLRHSNPTPIMRYDGFEEIKELEFLSKPSASAEHCNPKKNQYYSTINSKTKDDYQLTKNYYQLTFRYIEQLWFMAVEQEVKEKFPMPDDYSKKEITEKMFSECVVKFLRSDLFATDCQSVSAKDLTLIDLRKLYRLAVNDLNTTMPSLNTETPNSEVRMDFFAFVWALLHVLFPFTDSSRLTLSQKINRFYEQLYRLSPTWKSRICGPLSIVSATNIINEHINAPSGRALAMLYLGFPTVTILSGEKYLQIKNTYVQGLNLTFAVQSSRYYNKVDNKKLVVDDTLTFCDNLTENFTETNNLILHAVKHALLPPFSYAPSCLKSSGTSLNTHTEPSLILSYHASLLNQDEIKKLIDVMRLYKTHGNVNEIITVSSFSKNKHKEIEIFVNISPELNRSAYNVEGYARRMIDKFTHACLQAVPATETIGQGIFKVNLGKYYVRLSLQVVRAILNLKHPLELSFISPKSTSIIETPTYAQYLATRGVLSNHVATSTVADKLSTGVVHTQPPGEMLLV